MEAARCLIGYRNLRQIDPEAFSRLISVARSVAAFRPTNLVLFAEKYFMPALSGMLVVFFNCFLLQLLCYELIVITVGIIYYARAVQIVTPTLTYCYFLSILVF